MKTLPYNSPENARRSDGGSILLLSTLITGLLSLLSLSLVASINTTVNSAREAIPGFQADMAAHSAYNYALRQLALDPEWDGSDGEIAMPDGIGAFEVSRVSDPGDVPIIMSLTGRQGNAEVVLEVSLENGGDPLRDQALAALGPAVDFKQLNIDGNVLITDALEVVFDYTPDPLMPYNGTWALGGPGTLDDYDIGTTTIGGTLSKYTSTDYGTGDQRTITSPVMMPAWDLDSYLTPGPDRVIFDNTLELRNVVMEETAVFVTDPYDQIVLWDTEIRGGVVIHCPPEYDVRTGPRNEVYLKKTNRIGFGDNGAHPNIGVLAPGSSMRTPGSTGHPPFIKGLTYINSVDNTMGGEIHGQMIVINDVWHLMHFDFFFDENLADNLPIGIEYGGSASSWNILDVREVFVVDEALQSPIGGGNGY